MPLPSLDIRIDQICESIDRLVSTEFEARPGLSRGKIRFLYEAARERSSGPLARQAAQALIEATRSGGPVLLSNGWIIDFWYPSGEICGLIGATSLARAITSGLGVQVLFLTEEPVLPVFEKVGRAAGLRVYSPDHLKELPNVVAAQTFPIDEDEARAAATDLLDRLQPSAVITIEKCGRNKHGVYHTGQGTDMSSTTAKVDLLVEQARRRGVLTIGIGDLGNEIGFGSNKRMILAASGAGAIDSFTVAPTPTDGHGVDMHYSACLVELLRQLVLSRDTEHGLFASRT
jgi:hypothetical protein